MLVIDGSTVFAECDSDSIVWCSVGTLAWKNNPFSCDCHLMDESLCLECIDDAIEGREIHAWLSFFSDESIFEFGECDTRTTSEHLDKSLALFGDSIFRHERREVKMIIRDTVVNIVLNANVCI